MFFQAGKGEKKKTQAKLSEVLRPSSPFNRNAGFFLLISLLPVLDSARVRR
jgi:hypothetical protein